MCSFFLFTGNVVGEKKVDSQTFIEYILYVIEFLQQYQENILLCSFCIWDNRSIKLVYKSIHKFSLGIEIELKSMQCDSTVFII